MFNQLLGVPKFLFLFGYRLLCWHTVNPVTHENIDRCSPKAKLLCNCIVMHLSRNRLEKAVTTVIWEEVTGGAVNV
jgi:hypothetical protein